MHWCGRSSNEVAEAPAPDRRPLRSTAVRTSVSTSKGGQRFGGDVHLDDTRTGLLEHRHSIKVQ